MAKSKIDWSPGNWPILLFKLFTSYGLATLVLIFMTIVTLFGTLDQVELGLVAAKRKWFESAFVIHSIAGKIPVIIPGGMLLMGLLFTNMLLGAVVKVRKRWRGLGMLISHCGMLMLLAGGFVTWAFATDGYMALYPEMKSSRVESYREWQLEVMPVSKEGTAEKSFVIPTGALNALPINTPKTFDIADLPFAVKINSYAKNASPIPTSAPMAAQLEAKEVDGFKLAPQELSKKAEQNLPGAYVEFVPSDGSESVETILWAGSAKFDPSEKLMPFSFKIGDQTFAAALAKKTWTVPFKVQLDEFIFDRHPGVSTARNYESRVTRFEEGHEDQSLEIKMNEPMRHAGYTFFQESFGPPDGKPGEMYSQFAVANNPADQWPLIALIITGIGLLLHFILKLGSYTKRSHKDHSKKGVTKA